MNETLDKLSSLSKNPWTFAGLMLVLVAMLLTIGIIKNNREPAELPVQMFHWATPPMVFICEESQYTLEEVKTVIKYWENLGYTFSVIIDDADCGMSGMASQAITIGLPSPGYDMSKLGVADIRAEKDTLRIRSVRIEILSPGDRVLTHEFGHALGWDHLETIGHLMHPLNNSGGWDSFGLEFKSEK